MQGMTQEQKEMLFYRAKLLAYYARLACWKVRDFFLRRKAAKEAAAERARIAKAAAWASMSPQEQAAAVAVEVAKATAAANRPRQGCFSVGCCGVIIVLCGFIVAGVLFPEKHHAQEESEHISLSRDKWVRQTGAIAARHRETLDTYRKAGKDDGWDYVRTQTRSGEVRMMKQGDHVTELDVYVFDNVSQVLTESGEVRFMFSKALSSQLVPPVEE